MSKEIVSTIQELKNLDLSDYPIDLVRALVKKLNLFHCIKIKIHPGNIIVRGRPNIENEVFCYRHQLSYVPHECNLKYQRASSPNMSMFYGSILPENIGLNDLNNNRIVPLAEALPWIRNKANKGIRKITFSKWVTTKEINVIALVSHEDYYNGNSYTRHLLKNFKNEVKSSPIYEENTILISDFISREFAKSVIRDDYDYLISAAFSELVINAGLDGVFYPSVRMEGQGYSIAIKPGTVDKGLELIAAVECSVYKFYDKIFVDNDKGTALNFGQTYFEMFPIKNHEHAGVEACLKHLGLKSIEDLIN